jgi:hypothetical protein
VSWFFEIPPSPGSPAADPGAQAAMQSLSAGLVSKKTKSMRKMLVKQWIEGHPMFRQTRMEYYRISARFRMCISDFKNLMLYPFIKYHTYCNHQQP